MALYILMFKFLERIWEGLQALHEFNLLLIYS
jgi:hypothetical protein